MLYAAANRFQETTRDLTSFSPLALVRFSQAHKLQLNESQSLTFAEQSPSLNNLSNGPTSVHPRWAKPTWPPPISRICNALFGRLSRSYKRGVQRGACRHPSLTAAAGQLRRVRTHCSETGNGDSHVLVGRADDAGYEMMRRDRGFLTEHEHDGRGGVRGGCSEVE